MKNISVKSNALTEFNLARVGLGVAAAGIFLSTAYFNISSWVASAPSLDASIAYGLMSASIELMALCGLGWAGFQAAQRRWGRAALAIGFAASAIILNAMAAENFLHIQTDGLLNVIEASGNAVSVANVEIGDLQSQVQSLIDQNGGVIPRPVDAIEAQYSHFDPSTNPINMGQRDAEIALREEYNRLQAEISDLRHSSSADAVTANDTVRSVIPPHMIAPFIWGLEIIKGTIFFALGTTGGERKRKPSTPEEKRKWAIIRAKQSRSHLAKRKNLDNRTVKAYNK